MTALREIKLSQTLSNEMKFASSLISQFVARRKQLKYTQEDVDLIIGCANGLVAKWECGIRKPTLFYAFMWAEALKTDLSIVFENDILYKCTLPFPPSQNNLQRSARSSKKRTFRYNSKAYNGWLNSVPLLILPECGSIDFPVHIHYELYFPDKRLTNDIDNYIKAPQDYLVKQGVLFDDKRSIVKSFSVEEKGTDIGEPRIEITITRK